MRNARGKRTGAFPIIEALWEGNNRICVEADADSAAGFPVVGKGSGEILGSIGKKENSSGRKRNVLSVCSVQALAGSDIVNQMFGSPIMEIVVFGTIRKLDCIYGDIPKLEIGIGKHRSDFIKNRNHLLFRKL